MPQLVERKLSNNEIKEFSHYSAMGLDLLKVDPKDFPPEKIVETLDKYVDKLQAQSRNFLSRAFTKKPDIIDTALALGIVWGNQLVRLLHWQWTCIVGGELEQYGVASQDRSMIIYPTYYLRSCLEDPSVDCMAALSFNMLVAGSVPKFQENEYMNVLEGIHRIVPKR